MGKIRKSIVVVEYFGKIKHMFLVVGKRKVSNGVQTLNLSCRFESILATQISQIQGCELVEIGKLAFTLYRGSCATFSDNSIYLCFG